MLAYVFMPIEQNGYENVEKEEFDNVHNLLAAILSKNIAKQLKQGLYLEYIKCSDNLHGMHGKINISGTIRNFVMNKRALNCEFHELSENNIFNQIIKTTAILLLKHSEVKAKIKLSLKKEMFFFSNVDLIEPAKIQWQNINFEHNNFNNTFNYKVIINICRLIIEGMLLTTEKGNYKLASFIKPEQMNRLFEKFILEYYIKEHKEIKAHASQIEWIVDNGYKNMLPKMQSDITLSTANKFSENVLIIDAKYYQNITQNYYETRKLHSANMYQIFTYVKNKEASFRNSKIPHEVSGMLLYAGTDEEIQPDSIYKMSGNNIYVKTLNLNQNFKDIASQLDEISKLLVQD